MPASHGCVCKTERHELLQVQELNKRKIPQPMTESERKINRQILDEISKLTLGHEAGGFTIPASH